jgi:hypothetical protein
MQIPEPALTPLVQSQATGVYGVPENERHTKHNVFTHTITTNTAHAVLAAPHTAAALWHRNTTEVTEALNSTQLSSFCRTLELHLKKKNKKNYIADSGTYINRHQQLTSWHGATILSMSTANVPCTYTQRKFSLPGHAAPIIASRCYALL